MYFLDHILMLLAIAAFLFFILQAVAGGMFPKTENPTRILVIVAFISLIIASWLVQFADVFLEV